MGSLTFWRHNTKTAITVFILFLFVMAPLIYYLAKPVANTIEDTLFMQTYGFTNIFLLTYTTLIFPFSVMIFYWGFIIRKNQLTKKVESELREAQINLDLQNLNSDPPVTQKATEEEVKK